MTTPTFDLIPVPSRNALANPPPPATNQATTIDANFAKVNPWLAGKPQAWGWETLHPTSTQYFPYPVWSGTDMWPPITFTMPDCTFLILTISSLLDQVPTNGAARLGIVCAGNGFPGLSSTNPTFSNDNALVEAGGLTTTGLSGVITRANMSPGGSASVYAVYLLDAQATSGVWIAFGSLTVTAVM